MGPHFGSGYSTWGSKRSSSPPKAHGRIPTSSGSLAVFAANAWTTRSSCTSAICDGSWSVTCGIIMTGAHTGRWTWIVRYRGRSNGQMLGSSGKCQKWVGCILTMSGERRDDMSADLLVDGCDRFSGPTGGAEDDEWSVDTPPADAGARGFPVGALRGTETTRRRMSAVRRELVA
jgi:hypothetical protein